MTKTETAFYETLNMLGSDVLDETMQRIVDSEHAKADPLFAETLRVRKLTAKS